ncbi:MAG TPA: hypothetical protein VHP83_19305, partial [Aggregatilineaceae bacterium]|nr:hypothetical protein [Aggregatilineaceae bacterium]
MYRHSHLTLVVALVAALLISAVPAHAQPELTTIQLQLLDEIAGTLDSTTPELHYTLSVHEGEVFSILAWLDVREGLNIHLFDPAGVDVAEAIPVNISGDVYFVIDAIIPPQA